MYILKQQQPISPADIKISETNEAMLGCLEETNKENTTKKVLQSVSIFQAVESF
jgi:hypothetical protein